jgi:SPP1 gp7 family putative phage head morphogenesis protein
VKKKEQEQRERAIQRMEKQLEKGLLFHYKDALTEARGLLASYFARFGQGDELTLSQMRQMNRLESLVNQLEQIVNVIYEGNRDKLSVGVGSVYAESFYRTAFYLEKEVGVDLNFTLLSPLVVERAVQMPIDKLTLNKRLERNRKQLTAFLRREITNGLILGESYAKIGNRIKDSLQGDAKKAMRVARTETARVQNLGAYDSSKHVQDQGVQLKKIWVSSLDSRTRKSHQRADGQTVGFDESFTVGGKKAKHPHDRGLPAKEVVNCRCTYITEVEGFNPAITRRAGKDIIQYKTYDEWKTNRPAL